MSSLGERSGHGRPPPGRDAAVAAVQAAVDQAVLVARLEAVLAEEGARLSAPPLDRVLRRLVNVKDQMRTVLEAAGISIEDPAGRPLLDVEDSVEVTAWRHGEEFTEAVVAETEKAIVRYWGEVVSLGQVVAGAPKREE